MLTVCWDWVMKGDTASHLGCSLFQPSGRAVKQVQTSPSDGLHGEAHGKRN